MVKSLTSCHPWLRALLCLLILTDSMICHAAEVTARLDRESVQAGKGALLQIQIQNAEASEPQPPQVPDLIIRAGGRSHQMSLSGRDVSSTTTFSYQVGSMKPGDYTIPGFTLMVDGVEVKTEPLKLKVE